MLEEISFWPWISARSCSFKIPKIIVDLTVVEFCKGGYQMGGRLAMEDFVPYGFGGFSISIYQSTDLMSYDKLETNLPVRF